MKKNDFTITFSIFFVFPQDMCKAHENVHKHKKSEKKKYHTTLYLKDIHVHILVFVLISSRLEAHFAVNDKT